MIIALAAALLLQQTPAPETSDRAVCRIEAGSGTRFTTRVCMTAEQWAARREARDDGRRQYRRGNGYRSSDPGPGRWTH